MIISGTTWLPNDRVHAIPAAIGYLFKPTPIIDRDTEVETAPILEIVSTDSNVVFSVSLFKISSLIQGFYL